MLIYNVRRGISSEMRSDADGLDTLCKTSAGIKKKEKKKKGTLKKIGKSTSDPRSKPD